MLKRNEEFGGFPSEIWQIILNFLDLENQHFLSRISKEFYHITVSLWRIKLVKIVREISSIPFDYNEARTNLAMLSFLHDKMKPIDDFTLSELHDVLCKFDALTSSHGNREIMTNVSEVSEYFIIQEIISTYLQYSFFHDYNEKNCKYLDLIHKWPRPGQKSLERFLSGNQVSRCHLSD